MSTLSSQTVDGADTATTLPIAPQMTRPQIFLTRMVIFLGIVIVVTAVLFEMIERAFMANPLLNGLIVLVLLVGISYIARINVRRMLRERSNIFFVFVFPLAIILLIGAQFGGDFTPGIGTFRADAGELSAAIVEVPRLALPGPSATPGGATNCRRHPCGR